VNAQSCTREGSARALRKTSLRILRHGPNTERSGTVIALALTSQPQRAGFPLTSGSQVVPSRARRAMSLVFCACAD
jgi:hypothetical protein